MLKYLGVKCRDSRKKEKRHTEGGKVEGELEKVNGESG